MALPEFVATEIQAFHVALTGRTDPSGQLVRLLDQEQPGVGRELHTPAGPISRLQAEILYPERA